MADIAGDRLREMLACGADGDVPRQVLEDVATVLRERDEARESVEEERQRNECLSETADRLQAEVAHLRAFLRQEGLDGGTADAKQQR